MDFAMVREGSHLNSIDHHVQNLEASLVRFFGLRGADFT